MSTTQNIHWNRIAIEGAAIVASILLAFAIDAWWEDRQERALEVEWLTKLLEEFDTNIVRMDKRLADIGYEATNEVYGLLDDALMREKVVLNIPKLTLRRSVWAPTFEVDTPILDGIIRSGRLNQIKNMLVLDALSTWERNVRDFSELALRIRSNTDSHLVPALAKRGDIGSVLTKRYGRGEMVNAKPDPGDVVSIDIDLELKGLFAVKIENTGTFLLIFDDARQVADQVVKAIKTAQSE